MDTSDHHDERYRRIFYDTSEPILLIDSSGYVDANRAVLKALQLESLEDLIGKFPWHISPPLQRDGQASEVSGQALLEAAFATGNRCFEWTYARRDGTCFDVEVSLTRSTLNGRPVLISVWRDITERKRVEEDLRRHTEQLAALNSLSRAVSASLSLEAVVSAALREMLNTIKADLAFLFQREGERLVLTGIAPEEGRGRLGKVPEHRVGECMCGLSVKLGQPLYARDIFNDTRCTWEECKQAGLRSFAALPLRRGDEIFGVIGLASEQARDFESRSGFLETLAGTVAVSLHNAYLYAQARQIQARFEEAQVFTAAVLDSVPGMLYLYDETGHIVRWNKQHEEMTGYSSAEITGMHILDWFGGREPDTSRVSEAVRSAMETGRGHVEADLITKDGRAIPCYFTGVALEIAGKAYLTGIGIDITERVRAEEERRKLQDQLLQAQKIESVGRLAGGVAHDFNNMLSVILGQAELALMKLDQNAPLYTMLQQIQTAAQRSAELTRQLLAFARKQTIAPKSLDFNEAITGMLRMLRRLIGEDIEVVWAPGHELGRVTIDPAQLDQILANLLVNARDAIADNGKITIETGHARFDQDYCARHPGFTPGAYILLAVSDNGRGMDRATQAQIFEPFFTTKGLAQGTGLGLATVYGIVKQNQGFINVYSEPGYGSTFKIYLPCGTADAAQVVSETPVTEARGGSETILLVEDEPMILEITRKALMELGYTVLAERNPGEAVNRVRGHGGRVHLLITDIVMPAMNGRDLAQQLLAVFPDMKCLFMSGYTADVIAHHGVLDKGVHFLQKPFSMQVLAVKVREALEN